MLDEPTNGLDPQGIAEIRELLLDLHRGGTTVFLSSHLLAEVEQLCTRVGVLDRGRLVLQEQLATLHRADRVDGRAHRRPATGCGRRSTGGSPRSTGTGVVVRGADPAEVNARLVAAGVRSPGWRWSGRRSRRSCWPPRAPAPTGWTRR